jgi:hypothetical protein
MGAVIRACGTKASSYKNTGSGSNLFPAATAQIWLCDKSKKFTIADLNNPDIATVFNEWIHADFPEKVIPLFGNQITISGIANTKGTDNTVTLDNGVTQFVSYAAYTKVFSTTDGGMCFAKALLSFNNADLRIIEVDIKGNIVVKDNFDGTYSGLKGTLFAPAIDMADLKNPAKSYFSVSYMPDYFVNNAAILLEGMPLLDLVGLKDFHYEDAGGSTISVLNIKLIDDCCGDDVTDEYATELVLDKDNFTVVDAVTGTAIVPTGATTTAGKIALAGTYVAATKYNVDSVPPSDLMVANIEGIYIKPGVVSVP